jgi:predicted cobalt transporter CbtA
LPLTPDRSLSAAEWLRVALLSGLAATLCAIGFDLAFAEHVVDHAVAVEASHATGNVLTMAQPFSRAGQRGGLVVGELLLGAGTGLFFAGSGMLLGSRSRSPRRFWILAGLACVWGVCVLPSLAYPPLPPGAKSALPIGERQALYLATIALGLGGFAVATQIWAGRHRARIVLAVAAVLVPAFLAIVLFPDQRADSSISDALLTQFRLLAISSQLLFWTVLGAVGALLLRAGSGAPFVPAVSRTDRG